MGKYLFSIFFFFATVSIAQSATYFVDYTNSETTSVDTNNGTSTSTAWLHCPGDPRATDNANITLSAEDTVVFKGGVTYSFTDGGADDYIAANASGSSGSVITYISGHVYGTPWGSGRAVIDGTYANVSYGVERNGVISLFSYSYITIQGLEIKNLPDISDVGASLIGWYGNSGGNIVIDNNYIHNSGSAGIVIQGEWDAETPSGFIIQNNTVTLTNSHGIVTRYGMDDVLIYNNTLDLNGVEVYSGSFAGNNIAITYDAAGGGGSEVTNLIIRGNDCDDTAEDDPSYVPSKSNILMQQDTTGAIIEDNYFHGKPAYASIDFSGPQTDITIRNNVFHVQPATWQGALSFDTDQGSGVSYSGIDIFNNTFVCEPNTTANSIIYFGDGNSTQSPMFTDVDIRNNIIDTDTNTTSYLIRIDTEGVAPTVQMSTLTINNNAYQTGKADEYFSVEGTLYNFTEWKSYLSGAGAIGADADSNFGQVLFVDEGGNDFTLDSSDAVALNEGTTLGSFSDDKDGTSRPQGTAWDIGAFENFDSYGGGTAGRY